MKCLIQPVTSANPLWGSSGHLHTSSLVSVCYGTTQTSCSGLDIPSWQIVVQKDGECQAGERSMQVTHP